MKKLKKVTPRYTKVLTTANIDKEIVHVPGTDIEDPNKTREGYSGLQTIIAVGDTVRGLEPGMNVLVDFERYARPRQRPVQGLKNSIKGEMMTELEYAIPVMVIDGEEILALDDNDIKFIVDEFDDCDEVQTPVAEA